MVSGIDSRFSFNIDLINFEWFDHLTNFLGRFPNFFCRFLINVYLARLYSAPVAVVVQLSVGQLSCQPVVDCARAVECGRKTKGQHRCWRNYAKYETRKAKTTNAAIAEIAREMAISLALNSS